MTGQRYAHGCVNDPRTAYEVMRAPLGSCEKHGGTDPEEQCEWCHLRALLHGEPCFATGYE